MSIASKLAKLDTLRGDLADNLVTMGVTAADTEALDTLVPKVLTIEAGGDPDAALISFLEGTIPSVLPSGLTAIGTQLFYDYQPAIPFTSLPDGVLTIGAAAFYYCPQLALTSLPDSITDIGDEAFLYDIGCSFPTLPSALVNIGESAFYLCTGLTASVMPSGVVSIGDGAFEQSAVAFTELPIGITTLGAQVFSNCANLALASLPANLVSIGQICFSACPNVAISALPASLESIGNYAFSGTGITIQKLPQGFESLGNNVFQNCAGITKLWIPISCTSVGKAILQSNYAVHIYCEAASKPAGWNADWDLAGGSRNTVTWGVTEAAFDAL